MSQFARAAIIRAASTAAQTFSGYLAAASLLADVDWSVAASASGLAALASLVRSVAVGLPEAPDEPTSGPHYHEGTVR